MTEYVTITREEFAGYRTEIERLTMDICQKCRVKRARERREKEAADARRR